MREGTVAMCVLQSLEWVKVSINRVVKWRCIGTLSIQEDLFSAKQNC